MLIRSHALFETCSSDHMLSLKKTKTQMKITSHVLFQITCSSDHMLSLRETKTELSTYQSILHFETKPNHSYRSQRSIHRQSIHCQSIHLSTNSTTCLINPEPDINTTCNLVTSINATSKKQGSIKHPLELNTLTEY